MHRCARSSVLRMSSYSAFKQKTGTAHPPFKCSLRRIVEQGNVLQYVSSPILIAHAHGSKRVVGVRVPAPLKLRKFSNGSVPETDAATGLRVGLTSHPRHPLFINASVIRSKVQRKKKVTDHHEILKLRGSLFPPEPWHRKRPSSGQGFSSSPAGACARTSSSTLWVSRRIFTVLFPLFKIQRSVRCGRRVSS